jgi:Winged helix DNA-binding domain
VHRDLDVRDDTRLDPGLSAVSRRSLTQRQLNRAVLARQGLLEPFDDSLPKVLERVGGIQAQYAPSMYVGLWSRMRGLERSMLTHALEERTVVQGTLLRSTIHLVSRDDYWPFAVATRDQLREWFLRVSKGDPSAADLDHAADRVRSALADGPMRQTEIDALVGRSARPGSTPSSISSGSRRRAHGNGARLTCTPTRRAGSGRPTSRCRMPVRFWCAAIWPVSGLRRRPRSAPGPACRCGP